jgi:hypothetical protein
MHSYHIEEGYRFHYNGGFDGDIIINKIENKNVWFEAKINSEAIIALARGKTPEVIFPGQRVHQNHSTVEVTAAKFTVPREHIIKFVCHCYVSNRLMAMIESASEDKLLQMLPFVMKMDNEKLKDSGYKIGCLETSKGKYYITDIPSRYKDDSKWKMSTRRDFATPLSKDVQSRLKIFCNEKKIKFTLEEI